MTVSALVSSAVVPLTQVVLQALSVVDISGLWPDQALVNNNDSFHYIIVGGGTAGCVIANRLTEDKNVNVLMIEAGGDPPIESMLPGVFPLLSKSSHDWQFHGVNDGRLGKNLQDDVIFLSAGKVLGGSSSIDHMIYTQGHPDDYDSWAEAAGDDSWNWDGLLPYYKKLEQLKNQEIIDSPYVADHGLDGPLKIDRELHSVLDDYLNAYKELGHPTLIDTTASHILGYSQPLYTVYDKLRQSNAYAYITPVKDRENLYVMKHSVVTKILFNDDKEAIGVQVKKDNGDSITINACKEVIVSAGVYNSPKLLMLSGVGPKEQLESFNIDVVSDLPVGENYQDHTGVYVVHRMHKALKPELPLNPFQFPVPLFSGYASMNESKAQPDYQTLSPFFYHDTLAIILLCSTCFSFKDEICQTIFEANTLHDTLYTIVENLHPKSRGKVLLASADPEDYPLIHTNYLTDEWDIENHAKFVQDYSKVIESTFFKKSKAKFLDYDLPACADLEFRSLEYWKCYVIQMSSTTYHPASTCSMGPVLDNRLLVKGVKRLRVADASAMPTVISGNIKSAVMVLAEKASDLIKEYHTNDDPVDCACTSTREKTKKVATPIDLSNLKGLGKTLKGFKL